MSRPHPPRWAAGARRGHAHGRGGSPHEVSEWNVEGVSEEQQVLKVGHPVRVLPAVDGAVIAADAFAELELCEVRVDACGAQACPDLPAAGGYPVGHGVEWHPPTL
jgi:hypothetical protein